MPLYFEDGSEASAATLERSNSLRPAAELNDDLDTLPAPGEAPRSERPVIDVVTASLEDSKAEEVVAIDLRTKSALADHIVIASGRSNRHVSAVADHLLRDLKEAGFGSSKVEGLQNGDWVLIDAGDIIVHIFRPEVRSFYNLEKMWSVAETSETATR